MYTVKFKNVDGKAKNNNKRLKLQEQAKEKLTKKPYVYDTSSESEEEKKEEIKEEEK